MRLNLAYCLLRRAAAALLMLLLAFLAFSSALAQSDPPIPVR